MDCIVSAGEEISLFFFWDDFLAILIPETVLLRRAISF